MGGWFLFAVFWAVAFNLSLYFVFIGGIMLALWMLLSTGSKVDTWPRRLLALALTCAALLLLGAPWLILNLRESAVADPPFYQIAEVNFAGASLNSFPVPFLYHPWLASFARSLYRGEALGAGDGQFGPGVDDRRDSRDYPRPKEKGVVAGGRGGVGWPDFRARPDPALGRPDGAVARPEAAEPGALAGRPQLEAGLFRGGPPPAPFADAIPLPALLLSVFVPFWERGRVFARYALAASMAVMLLAGMALVEVRRLWPDRPIAGLALQLALAGVLLVEIVPPPLTTLPSRPRASGLYVAEPANDARRGYC